MFCTQKFITDKRGFMPLFGYCCALLFSAAFLFSCENDPDENSENSAEQILKSSGKGDFRGVNMGDRFENVRNTEGSEFVYSMPDELVYRIPVSGLDSVWYEISYNFNEQGLYDINLEVHAKTLASLKILADNFETHYMEKYGVPVVKNTLLRWRTMTESGRFVNITLRDSLSANEEPFLQVNFNESEK